MAGSPLTSHRPVPRLAWLNGVPARPIGRGSMVRIHSKNKCWDAGFVNKGEEKVCVEGKRKEVGIDATL